MKKTRCYIYARVSTAIQVDGVQAGVDDDARHDALHTEAGLQKGCHETGAHARRHGRQQRQERVPCQRHLTRHGAAQGKAAVGGQVRNVQDGIAQKQRQRHQGVNAAQLQRGLNDIERKDTRQHVCAPLKDVFRNFLPSPLPRPRCSRA